MGPVAADLDGEPGLPGGDEQGPDGGAVAVGDRGHVGGDGAGDGGGLVEGGLELPDVGQVDVAGGAHGGGFTFAGGQEVEPCLRWAGVVGHGFRSLVKVTVVPCADGSIVTSSMRACMKMIPWPRVPGAGCSRSAGGDRQLPVSATVSWTVLGAARAVRVIWTGAAPAGRPAVACSKALAAASPAAIMMSVASRLPMPAAGSHCRSLARSRARQEGSSAGTWTVSGAGGCR